MRPFVLAQALALAATAALIVVMPATAAASGVDRATAARTGGTAFGAPLPPSDAQPVATRLAASPREITAGDAAPTISVRVRQRGTTSVRARIVVVRLPGSRPVARVDLGRIRTGRTMTVALPPSAQLRTGRYVVRLHAADARGHRLLRTARHAGRTRIVVHRRSPAITPAAIAPAAVALLPPAAPSPGGPGVFPVAGAFDFGSAENRFGAGRDGHVHEGQDILAAAGTPVVAPYAGTIGSTSYQAVGAGEYVVLDAVDGRDYFLAHCLRGSTAVEPGAIVAADQQLCQVGATGTTDGANHLHFEIWTVGWRIPGGAPIDPLPELRAWSGS